MKHFKAEEWIDFVNHMASGDRQEAMQKHLGAGCKRCMETVALWQRVANAAAVEASYQPAAESVRVVKAAFATAGWAAGARSAAMGMRQMLYRAEPYQIDIQIEAQPERNRLVVTGQLLDVSHPEIVGRDVQVSLSNRRGNVIHTVTNQFGEFRGDVQNSGDLELSFPGRGGKPIVISLRDALDQLPGAKE